jgi:hypothetical protein
MKKIASLVLVLVMVLGLAACAGAQPESENVPVNNSQGDSRFIHDVTPTSNSGGVERWEYMQFEHHFYYGTRTELDERLNELGVEGWELIVITDQGSNTRSHVFIMKRRLP